MCVCVCVCVCEREREREKRIRQYGEKLKNKLLRNEKFIVKENRRYNVLVLIS